MSQLAQGNWDLSNFVLLYTTCRFGHRVPAIYILIDALEIGSGKGWMKGHPGFGTRSKRARHVLRSDVFYHISYILALGKSKASVMMTKEDGRARYQNIIKYHQISSKLLRRTLTFLSRHLQIRRQLSLRLNTTIRQARRGNLRRYRHKRLVTFKTHMHLFTIHSLTSPTF